MFVTNRQMLGTKEYLIKKNSLICIVLSTANEITVDTHTYLYLADATCFCDT